MRSSRKFTPRITKCNGFYIYSGPCSKCPSSVEPWINQFCDQPGNEWYAKMEVTWAQDSFNQYGLNELLPNFDLALEMITDSHSDQWIYLSDSNIEAILVQAKHLYGLLHARYIIQFEGIRKMRQKYLDGLFGTCPRVLCENEKLLPVGTSHKIRHHSLKLYCPKCNDIYKCPPNIQIDGAHFGPAFPHVFFTSYTKFDSFKNFKPFKMQMFGFPVHRSILPDFMPHEKNEHHRDQYIPQ